MNRLLRHLQARPRMVIAVILGLVVGLLASTKVHATSAWLIGWNAGIWSYLLLMAWLMARADQHHLLRTARNQAEGAAVVLGLVVLAAVASVVAIVAELASSRTAGGQPATDPQALGPVLLAVSTVLGGWLLLPVVFTLSYAAHYFRGKPGGLGFPHDEPPFQPQYSDFLYFAFTIAVAAQTSDVTVTRRDMRRLVLLQAVLSFGFNTAILAMAINIAAGLL